MTSARLTGPRQDPIRTGPPIRRFEFVVDRGTRGATAGHGVARRPHVHVPPPPVRGRASWLRDAVRVYTLLIAALSPQRTGHGPTHGTPRTADRPVPTRRGRPDTPPGTYYTRPSRSPPR